VNSGTGRRSASSSTGVSARVAGTRTPRSTIVATAAAVGHRNWAISRSPVVLRQARSGAAPARNSSTSPSGVIHRLKNAAPMVLRSPNRCSVIVGSIVTNSTNTAHASRIQLFTRNAVSREANDSKAPLLRSRGSR
jgi:hypothetical protein